MSIIFYVITSRNGLYTRYIEEGRYVLLYHKVMFLTNDHNIASEASSWCEHASVGDIYEHEVFTIQITEFNKVEIQ